MKDLKIQNDLSVVWNPDPEVQSPESGDQETM